MAKPPVVQTGSFRAYIQLRRLLVLQRFGYLAAVAWLVSGSSFPQPSEVFKTSEGCRVIQIPNKYPLPMFTFGNPGINRITQVVHLKSFTNPPVYETFLYYKPVRRPVALPPSARLEDGVTNYLTCAFIYQ